MWYVYTLSITRVPGFHLEKLLKGDQKLNIEKFFFGGGGGGAMYRVGVSLH